MWTSRRAGGSPVFRFIDEDSTLFERITAVAAVIALIGAAMLVLFPAFVAEEGATGVAAFALRPYPFLQYQRAEDINARRSEPPTLTADHGVVLAVQR